MWSTSGEVNKNCLVDSSPTSSVTSFSGYQKYLKWYFFSIKPFPSKSLTSDFRHSCRSSCLFFRSGNVCVKRPTQPIFIPVSIELSKSIDGMLWVTPTYHQTTLTIQRYPFILVGGEKHSEKLRIIFFFTMKISHTWEFSLLIMYMKKLRAPAWLRTSAFSCNTKAKL